MKERLKIDSLMTPDGDVVGLELLGPLGPVDAKIRRIPLDTKYLFDAEGRPVKVRSFEFEVWPKRWTVHLDPIGIASPDSLYLSSPDSWEKLLEDLGRAEGVAPKYMSTCGYFNRGAGPYDCSKCGTPRPCGGAMLKDIAARIRKLRGDGDAD